MRLRDLDVDDLVARHVCDERGPRWRADADEFFFVSRRGHGEREGRVAQPLELRKRITCMREGLLDPRGGHISLFSHAVESLGSRCSLAQLGRIPVPRHTGK